MAASTPQRTSESVNGADKAGRQYWDNVWARAELPLAVNPFLPGLAHYIERKFDDYFRRALSERTTRAGRLLEIGAGRSPWLPYFARRFGLEVHGVDYSDVGCRQALAILERENVAGGVTCADLFSPPAELLEAFDVVVSMGVAEHFRDTAACISAFARFLRPGGLMITSIPNFAGTLGWLQKALNRPVFDVHVPLDRRALGSAHRAAGLDVVSCDYFLVANLSVVNLENLAGTRAHVALTRLGSWVSKAVWMTEGALPAVARPNRWTSPYVICLARKTLPPVAG